MPGEVLLLSWEVGRDGGSRASYPRRRGGKKEPRPAGQTSARGISLPARGKPSRGEDAVRVMIHCTQLVQSDRYDGLASLSV
jgi:hypothetical protein